MTPELDDDDTGEHEALPSLFEQVAAELRKRDYLAAAEVGGGGLPVVAIAVGNGESWRFGAHPEAIQWMGDYYVGGSYFDAAETGVLTTCVDPVEIADGIVLAVGNPPGADALDEQEV